ncbi:hypothetical protein SAMN04487996_1267 [Dyadobacter soli]|uniref:ZU5 domain-containing protein n=1 Tax=Dyadobacter soli TaxID=659014 RepID=A0A1G7YF12_9BACT|nr:hypothetical protein [Dyadobacter soli]SDG95023.1 hypothetical protein SAMN04487996_1267 [Dyadobacter soli]
MKRISYFIICLLLTLGACKENTDPTPVDGNPEMPGPPANEAGAVQPVGTPEGAAVVKTIGAAGGTIASGDGRFTVTVPAGALDKDVAISMQPISNTNGSGVGAGYRMLPDGQKFLKALTMTFAYTEEEVEQTMPEALGIAYQNKEGVWMSVGGLALDKAKKSISIEVDHFTDFTFFEYVWVDPVYKAIDPGRSVTIRAYGLGTINILAKKLPKGMEVALPKPNEIDYIDGWQLEGEGKLSGSGKEVVYLAPGEIPAKNPATVTLKLTSPTKEVAELYTRIYVVPEGVSLQVGGGGWIHLPISGANLSGAIKGIDAQDGSRVINIKWHGGSGAMGALGTFKWTVKTVTAIYKPDQTTQYMHFYGKAPYVSDGSLKVDAMRYGELMGTFDVQPAGLYVTTYPPVISTSSMRGVFRVKCFDCAK